MLRFTMNRWWAFVLTLCLLTSCSLLLTAQFPSVAGANPSTAYMPSDDEQPQLPSVGDPDVPMGPGDGKAGKSFARRGEQGQVLRQSGARPVGDGVAPTSVVMNRLRLIALSLRSFYLRF
jgi:hypothetical protein